MLVHGTGYIPKSFSNYDKVEFTLNVSEDVARTIDTSGQLVVPFHDKDRTGTVVPVRTIERASQDGVVKHVFYGYYVVFKNGQISEILDAGIYERVFPESSKDIELGLPARIVKKFHELDKKELNELASATPTEFLLPLHLSGQKELVSKIVSDIIRKDPLKVCELPDSIIRKYVFDNDDPLIRTALMENTPAMIKVLENELKSRGFVEAEKLSIVYYRYWDEVQEDEVLERASRRREYRRYDEMRARLTALGVAIPLSVAMISLPVVTRQLPEKRRDEEEKTVKSAT